MSLRPSLILAAAVAAALTATAAQAAARSDNCFLGRDWAGWSAPGDGDALLLRVNLRDIYRVELTPGSHVRKFGDEFLVNKQRGSDWICSPLDLDLTLAEHHGGIRQPLIAKSIRKLTPQEIAAIPKKDLP